MDTVLNEYKPHELAERMPAMSAEDYAGLKEDIRAKGLLDPIVLHEGKILDGINRFNACNEVGATPAFVDYEGDDAWGYVISKNVKRRHLTGSQRAIFAVERVTTSHGGDRKSDQGPNSSLDNGDRVSDQGEPVHLDNQYSESGHLNSDDLNDEVKPSYTLDDAAKDAEVSVRTAKDAFKVHKSGDEDLIESVKSGEVSAKKAAETLKEDKYKPHLSQGTGNPEHYTNPTYLDAVRLVIGDIDLDPASNSIANENVRAKQYYDKEDDGLKQHWVADTLFINPPFSTALCDAFANKLVDHYRNGDVKEAIWLSNNTTDTQRMVGLFTQCSAIFLHTGRHKFLSAGEDGKLQEGQGLQGQISIYLGSDADKFLHIFHKEQNGFGFVPSTGRSVIDNSVKLEERTEREDLPW